MIANDLTLLSQDLHMLQDETWVPDYASTQASIDTLNRITSELIKRKVLPSNFRVEE